MNAEKTPFGQIEDQQKHGYSPSVLVTRSGEKGISVGTYLGPSKDHPDLYKVSVDGGTGVRYESAENLTDTHQAELAERLADSPLLSALGKDAVKSVQLESDTANSSAKPELILAIPDDIVHPRAVQSDPGEKLDIADQQLERLKSRLEGYISDISRALNDSSPYPFRNVATVVSNELFDMCQKGRFGDKAARALTIRADLWFGYELPRMSRYEEDSARAKVLKAKNDLRDLMESI